MPRGNPSPKLAITIDPDVHENILAAAARDGVSVSAWMTAAAREALQRRAGLAAVALWEKQHGRLTNRRNEWSSPQRAGSAPDIPNGSPFVMSTVVYRRRSSRGHR